MPQQALLPSQRLTLLRAFQRFQNGGAEPHQSVFEDVVSRAAFEIGDGRLLIERSRHQDERRVGHNAARELERLPSAEAGDVVIAQDDVRRELAQRESERGFSLDVMNDGRRGQSLELVTDQRGIALAVLDYEDPYL